MTTEPQPVSLTPIAPLHRPFKLRETVLGKLRTAIVTGELAEGALVSAPTLGHTLGVSATPVREAMMDLAREGLVDTVKNKGFRVTAMSEKELDDLAQIRLLLEPPAMHWIAGKIPADALRELTELADTCTRAAENEDLEEYLRTDREFHAQLLSFAGNTQLVDLATTLRMRTRMYGLRALAGEGLLAATSREHHELLRLVAAGDAVSAERLLAQHIGHARELWATGTQTS